MTRLVEVGVLAVEFELSPRTTAVLLNAGKLSSIVARLGSTQEVQLVPEEENQTPDVLRVVVFATGPSQGREAKDNQEVSLELPPVFKHFHHHNGGRELEALSKTKTKKSWNNTFIGGTRLRISRLWLFASKMTLYIAHTGSSETSFTYKAKEHYLLSSSQRILHDWRDCAQAPRHNSASLMLTR